MPGCRCGVCTSSDIRNRRNRCSIVVTLPGGNLLIDTPPELRLSCLRDNISRIEAVALTHTHADHIMGMDDIRRFNDVVGGHIPIHAEPGFLDDLRRVFQYVFVSGQAGGGKPKLDLTPIVPGATLSLLGASVLPLRVYHGDLPITAFRIGCFAYVTDVSRIPDATLQELQGLDTLILGAIRDQPHSTHFSISQAIEVIEQLKPRRAFLTHMTHDVEHGELSARLPAGIQPAYDGLVLTMPSPMLRMQQGLGC